MEPRQDLLDEQDVPENHALFWIWLVKIVVSRRADVKFVATGVYPRERAENRGGGDVERGRKGRNQHPDDRGLVTAKAFRGSASPSWKPMLKYKGRRRFQVREKVRPHGLGERIIVLTLGCVEVNLKLSLIRSQCKQSHIFPMGVYRAQNDKHKGAQKLHAGNR
jgi:hypothetical protein